MASSVSTACRYQSIMTLQHDEAVQAVMAATMACQTTVRIFFQSVVFDDEVDDDDEVVVEVVVSSSVVSVVSVVVSSHIGFRLVSGGRPRGGGRPSGEGLNIKRFRRLVRATPLMGGQPPERLNIAVRRFLAR